MVSVLVVKVWSAHSVLRRVGNLEGLLKDKDYGWYKEKYEQIV